MRKDIRRSEGIRNPEITRVYNIPETSASITGGIRNPEITRVYNRPEREEKAWEGIRNPEITRVYNRLPDIFAPVFGIRNPEITRVYNISFLSIPLYTGIRNPEITVFSFVVILNMGDQFTKEYNLRRRMRVTLTGRCSNLRFKVQNEDYTLGIQSSNLLPKGRR